MTIGLVVGDGPGLQADIVFYSGLLLEGKMADTLERVARGGKPVHANCRVVFKTALFTGAWGGW